MTITNTQDHLMKAKYLLPLLAAGLTCVSSVSQAREKPLTGLYTGIGVHWNQLSGFDDAPGGQVFIGSHFKSLMTTYVQADLELGYSYAGDFKHKIAHSTDTQGFWLSGLLRLPLTPTFEILGRLGVDFGDDDGLLAGVGIGANLNQQWQLRLETIKRRHTDSIQLNAAYHY
jgi:hypothetical protein